MRLHYRFMLLFMSLVLIFPAASTWAAPVVFTTTDAPAPILDNTFSLDACQVIDVPAIGPAQSVQVRVSLNHTWVRDLGMEMRSPQGTRLTIMNRPNDSHGNLFFAEVPLLFSDTAPSGISASLMGSGCGGTIGAGAGNCGDNFLPDPVSSLGASLPSQGTNFSDFVGEEIQGEWQLCVADFASGDAGNLVSWQLLLEYAGPVVDSVSILGPAAPADDTVTFRVAFVDTVTDISTDGFALTTTGTADGTISAVSTASGTTVDVTVSDITGTGTLRLDVTATGFDFDDVTYTGPFSDGEIHSVDRDPPAIDGVSFDQASIDATNQEEVSFTLDGAEVGVSAEYVITSDGGAGDVTDTFTVTSADQQISDVDVSALPDGELTLTLTLTDAAGNESVVTDTVQKLADPPDDTPVIIEFEENVEIDGVVRVDPTGVLSGGQINGLVFSSGLVAGNMTLGPDARVIGGTVSGHLSGAEGSPARLSNVTVTSGTILENVVISSTSILEPGVIIGPGVRFASGSLIPEGIDLTESLQKGLWAAGDGREVVMLGGDVLTGQTQSLIRAIQLLDDYEPAGNSISQNAETGELVITMADSRSVLVPVSVQQAAADESPGTYVNENGDVVFVTGTRRVVLSYPALASQPALMDALAELGLTLGFNERANLQVQPGNGMQGVQALSAVDVYYSARPGLLVSPAPAGAQAGMVEQPAPGLGHVTQVSLIFAGDNGELLQQDLVPVPADWLALRQALLALDAVTAATIDEHGVITALVDGESVTAVMDYTVYRDAAPPGSAVQILEAGDITGNGAPDFEVIYTNGDTQYLFLR